MGILDDVVEDGHLRVACAGSAIAWRSSVGLREADLLTTRTRMGWFGMRCTTLAAAVIREKRERSCRLGRYSRLTLGRADVESDGQRLGSMPDVSP